MTHTGETPTSHRSHRQDLSWPSWTFPGPGVGQCEHQSRTLVRSAEVNLRQVVQGPIRMFQDPDSNTPPNMTANRPDQKPAAVTQQVVTWCVAVRTNNGSHESERTRAERWSVRASPSLPDGRTCFVLLTVILRLRNKQRVTTVIHVTQQAGHTNADSETQTSKIVRVHRNYGMGSQLNCCLNVRKLISHQKRGIENTFGGLVSVEDEYNFKRIWNCGGSDIRACRWTAVATNWCELENLKGCTVLEKGLEWMGLMRKKTLFWPWKSEN